MKLEKGLIVYLMGQYLPAAVRLVTYLLTDPISHRARRDLL